MKNTSTETDMIGIDSAAEMRRKIQEKIKEEKEKNIKGVINIRIKTIDEKNCEFVLRNLYDKFENHFDKFSEYEKKYYTNVLSNKIENLIELLFTTKLSQMSKEDIIKAYADDYMNGISSAQDMDNDDQINLCADFEKSLLAQCLVKHMTDILAQTEV